MDNANIWLKELELSDGREYCSLLIELASYDDVYARPVPRDFSYDDFGIENVIYTANSDNSQSKRSIEKIGGELISIHDGYHFYGVDLTKKIDEIRRRRVK